MSDNTNADTQSQEQPIAATPLPSQTSPQDTSNWDDRPFTTPTGRVVIETYQGNDGNVIAE